MIYKFIKYRYARAKRVPLSSNLNCMGRECYTFSNCRSGICNKHGLDLSTFLGERQCDWDEPTVLLRFVFLTAA